MYQTKYRRSYLRKVLRWWSLWQIPEQIYGKKRNMYILYTYLYIILRFVKQYYLYLGVVLFLCRTLWLAIFRLICVPFALVDYSCSLCLSYLLKPRIKLFYKLLHSLSYKREINYRINFMISKDKKEAFIAKWLGHPLALKKKGLHNNKFSGLQFQSELSKLRKPNRWVTDDVYVPHFKYLAIVEGKVANSSLIYRILTYLFILMKTSIYNFTSNYSHFFIHKHMSGWYSLLTQVKVISSLSGLGHKGWASRDLRDSAISGDCRSSFLKTILSLFHIWSLFRRKFKEVLLQTNTGGRSFKVESEDVNWMSQVNSTNGFFRQYKTCMIEQSRLFSHQAKLSSEQSQKVRRFSPHVISSKMYWSPFWKLSKELGKMNTGEKLSKWYSYCGHKAYFYYRARHRSLFFRLQEYSDIEYGDKYLFRSIFSFINNACTAQSKWLNKKRKHFYFNKYQKYLKSVYSVGESSYPVNKKEGRLQLYKNKGFSHRTKQILTSPNVSSMYRNRPGHLSEKLMQVLLRLMFSSPSKGFFRLREPFAGWRVSSHANDSNDSLGSSYLLHDVQSSSERQSHSFSSRLWRFFSNLDNHVFFMRFSPKSAPYKNFYGLRTLSFDYLSFFFNTFSQGSISTQAFLQKRSKQVQVQARVKAPLYRRRIQGYVSKSSALRASSKEATSLFHFFKSYIKYDTPSMWSRISFFDSLYWTSSLQKINLFRKSFIPLDQFPIMKGKLPSGNKLSRLLLNKLDQDKFSQTLSGWYLIRRGASFSPDFVKLDSMKSLPFDPSSSIEWRIYSNLCSIFFGRRFFHLLFFPGKNKFQRLFSRRLYKYSEWGSGINRDPSKLCIHKARSSYLRHHVTKSRINQYVKYLTNHSRHLCSLMPQVAQKSYLLKLGGGTISNKTMRYPRFRWIQKRYLGLFKWKIKEQIRFYLKKRRRRWYRRIGARRTKRYFKLLKRWSLLQRQLSIKQSQFSFFKKGYSSLYQLVSRYKKMYRCSFWSFFRFKSSWLSKQEIFNSYLFYFNLYRFYRTSFRSNILQDNASGSKNYLLFFKLFSWISRRSASSVWSGLFLAIIQSLTRFCLEKNSTISLHRKGHEHNVIKGLESTVNLKANAKSSDLREPGILVSNKYALHLHDTLSPLDTLAYLRLQARYRSLKIRLSMYNQFNSWCMYYYAKLFSVYNTQSARSSAGNLKNWFLQLWIRFYWKLYLHGRSNFSKSKKTSQRLVTDKLTIGYTKPLYTRARSFLNTQRKSVATRSRWSLKNSKLSLKLKRYTRFGHRNISGKHRYRKKIFRKNRTFESQRFSSWIKQDASQRLSYSIGGYSSLKHLVTTPLAFRKSFSRQLFYRLKTLHNFIFMNSSQTRSHSRISLIPVDSYSKSLSLESSLLRQLFFLYQEGSFTETKRSGASKKISSVLGLKVLSQSIHKIAGVLANKAHLGDDPLGKVNIPMYDSTTLNQSLVDQLLSIKGLKKQTFLSSANRRPSWSLKPVKTFKAIVQSQIRNYTSRLATSRYSKLNIQYDPLVSVFGRLFKQWIKRYFYLSFYQHFQNACFFKYFNPIMSGPSSLDELSTFSFLKCNNKSLGFKKYKESLFKTFKIVSHSHYSLSRYISFPHKGATKEMLHTRRRLHYLFQLGLKSNRLNRLQEKLDAESGNQLLDQMFRGIPSYVFSQATGKELAWEDLFYAGSLKQWWMKLASKWQSQVRKTKVVNKSKLPWIPWKGRQLKFPWSKSGRKRSWRPTHNLTSLRKFSQSFPGILAVSGLHKVRSGTLSSNSVFKWFHGSNTLFGKMALSVFNLDFHRSIHFNINFYSTSWVKQMYASHHVRGFFNKQSFWMPLGKFQVWNEVCLHFFSLLVFLFKYISISFSSLNVLYSQLFLYLYFCFKDVISNSSNQKLLPTYAMYIPLNGSLSDSYFLIQHIIENTLYMIHLLSLSYPSSKK